MIKMQVNNIQKTLEWIATCPFEATISSMTGGFVHLKIMVPDTVSIEIDKEMYENKTIVDEA